MKPFTTQYQTEAHKSLKSTPEANISNRQVQSNDLQNFINIYKIK